MNRRGNIWHFGHQTESMVIVVQILKLGEHRLNSVFGTSRTANQLRRWLLWNWTTALGRWFFFCCLIRSEKYLQFFRKEIVFLYLLQNHVDICATKTKRIHSDDSARPLGRFSDHLQATIFQCRNILIWFFVVQIRRQNASVHCD